MTGLSPILRFSGHLKKYNPRSPGTASGWPMFPMNLDDSRFTFGLIPVRVGECKFPRKVAPSHVGPEMGESCFSAVVTR